jgi:hypothetical protein
VRRIQPIPVFPQDMIYNETFNLKLLAPLSPSQYSQIKIFKRWTSFLLPKDIRHRIRGGRAHSGA